MSNRLRNETSPYLLQHAENPVDWFPWGEEAFAKAKREDKPIFLSIGYSTCHWCHVMAHESFEDAGIAALLNRYFVAVKVDKEERPDIDSIYMTVCQMFTGSGGWPTTVFMTADKQPFYAGTYFPKDSVGRGVGLRDLLVYFHEAWVQDRASLLEQAEDVVTQLRGGTRAAGRSDAHLAEKAAELFQDRFDDMNGGFGRAPKFPMPHNLLFLLRYYRRYRDKTVLAMAERTLTQMYCGGLFDHIGGGFCRYSTDTKFLVPHFEKMLYDNALLILAYCKAYAVTKKQLYLSVAERTAAYVLREMTAPAGGFYSAQDADSEGEEGKYYLFTPMEIQAILGDADGARFNRYFDITEQGNFEGKNIPNLLQAGEAPENLYASVAEIYAYRKQRHTLHTDDKVLTAWNGLMIAALCELYRVSGKNAYLTAAQQADRFAAAQLCDGDTLYVSVRAGQRGVKGFLDDYAMYIYALLCMHRATWNMQYLDRAKRLCEKVLSDFYDAEDGGFFLYGKDGEQLIHRPKEMRDGAMPGGNTMMAWNLVRLSQLLNDDGLDRAAKRQLDLLAAYADYYPPEYATFLCALLEYSEPPRKIHAVLAADADRASLPLHMDSDDLIVLHETPTAEYPLKNGKTTYYVCEGYSCRPPVNAL